MHLFAGILENLLVMVLTIVVLAGGFYLLLLVLNVWLKMKTGSREEEGLSDLWVAAVKEAKQNSEAKDSADK